MTVSAVARHHEAGADSDAWDTAAGARNVVAVVVDGAAQVRLRRLSDNHSVDSEP